MMLLLRPFTGGFRVAESPVGRRRGHPLYPRCDQLERVEYGHYSVVDADAYRYLDNAHQHRVSLLVENLFDRDYVTSRSSNVDNLGRPFTTEVRYTYRF